MATITLVPHVGTNRVYDHKKRLYKTVSVRLPHQQIMVDGVRVGYIEEIPGAPITLIRHIDSESVRMELTLAVTQLLGGDEVAELFQPPKESEPVSVEADIDIDSEEDVEEDYEEEDEE